MIPTHDNTMLRDYARCKRLYAVHHVRGWRARGKARPLSYGKLVHVGLDTYYKTLKETGDISKALFAALETMKEKPYVDDLNDFRTKARALYDMQRYVIHYKGDRGWNILLTETSFDIEDEDGFNYGGIGDLVIRDQTERVFPVDHKTTTRFGAFFYDNYKMDPQMHGYDWAAGKLTGEHVHGVMINTIILHKKETKFDRKPIIISHKHVARWRDRNLHLYQEIAVRRSQDPNGEDVFNQQIWTPSFEHCVDRYGQCPMFQVCHADPGNAELHLRNHFAPGKWDFTNPDANDED